MDVRFRYARNARRRPNYIFLAGCVICRQRWGWGKAGEENWGNEGADISINGRQVI